MRYFRLASCCLRLLILGALFGAGATHAAPFAYISNHGSNNVSVIDTAANTVVATVPVGSTPNGVAVNPPGTFVYVTNEGSNDVSVINTATNAVVATVPVGGSPFGVAVTPAGTFAYVTIFSGTISMVSVINTATNTVVATVPVGIHATGVALNRAGTFAYVTNNGSNTVSVISTTTNAVIATVPVGAGPIGVAINSAGTFAYVANASSNTVSMINTATNTVVATVTVGSGPYAIAVNPTGTFAYVTNDNGANVSVINTATKTVVATVPVGLNPEGIAINRAGTFAYVTNLHTTSNSVSVIDIATNTVVATVPVGSNPAAFGDFIGPAPPQLSYTPVAPCRLVDTRVAVGALGARSGRDYAASDDTRIGQAGGNPAGCNIPVGPEALALTLTAVQPTQVGNLIAYPAGGAVPLASALNFLAGQIIANTTVVPINAGSGDNFSVFNNSDGITPVVVDVVGYFWEYLSADCSKATQSLSVSPGDTIDVPAVCSTGYVPVGGGCSTDTAGASNWLSRSATVAADGYHCTMQNSSPGSVTVTADTMCCRRAGR